MTKKAGNRRIILLHDTYSATAKAIERIVPWLAQRDYVFLTVSELMELTGGINTKTMIYH